MYTGTLIKDLMAAVERAEQSARQKRMSEEMHFQQLFDLQTPQRAEQIFAGAA
jgi:hypothetical protein